MFGRIGTVMIGLGVTSSLILGMQSQRSQSELDTLLTPVEMSRTSGRAIESADGGVPPTCTKQNISAGAPSCATGAPLNPCDDIPTCNQAICSTDCTTAWNAVSSPGTNYFGYLLTVPCRLVSTYQVRDCAGLLYDCSCTGPVLNVLNCPFGSVIAFVTCAEDE